MRWLVFLALVPVAATADAVIATQTIRPQQIITADAVRLDPGNVTGAHTLLDAVIGQEARTAIYPGRAVMRGAVGAPALVDRNQAVELVYAHGGLRIKAEGRALGRGAAGERIRVMNVDSRTVLFGTITSNGSILVNK
ncbi:flagellar basal body P-ring formation chaperone FlgA [Mameliella sediminis]|uniref:flagellar basal body P-ring formation chaperone FlgA n=1 Tax=Mameliella sediminis TaxID=2836866 RepID=UPI001C43F77B|nr:flagellar basal body P-ring formation chaperone FlgA [Mameliella sediminis]MBY6114046.1 flagellar basal body P-ring formation protein FlgA [Antarctobacter heliothermus]MBY6142606.1 flagellar basal body P-ring formation protein FlgA [Mameliella alba]MBV7395343.1 flagellar basal body P-ring formation protein FlgA [Mameliella sediminis]MBY6159461.1 flagellar basal body P-ring formation protein FlgA [Mameliella alba]MBY6167932.1 flagellar basal body P-ring formation protein FlgA [Mameliella alb